MRVLRSMLFTPGNNPRMIDKAATLGADAVILDLEDAVPMAEKDTARVLVKDAVEVVGAQGTQVFVRPNAIGTGLTAEDLRWSVQRGLTGIVLPKTESREQVLEAVDWIRALEAERDLDPGSVVLMPLLETAKGVLSAQEIAAASERIVAVAFGAVDYTRDMGTSLSAEAIELFYAQSYIALVARAYGVQAIDSPCITIRDQEVLVAEARRSRQLGYRGKLLIHPGQIEPVNQVFSPSEEEVAHAQRVVDAFRQAEAQGLGAISLDGTMIDVANARQAKDLLSWAEAIDRKRDVRHVDKNVE
ncbi:MAG TPA: CoA ester lyase [Anaerolineae bacterium]|nr:CoA ester lyase [Anaerolineae bacterium]